jgi:hypothetical protein
MMKRMVLAGLLSLAAVPALAADTSTDRKASVTSTDEARALAGRGISAKSKADTTPARGCTCAHG